MSTVARIEGNIECAELVERYINYPKDTIDKLRKEICWTTYEAELLALTIFSSDDLLKINITSKNLY